MAGATLAVALHADTISGQAHSGLGHSGLGQAQPLPYTTGSGVPCMVGATLAVALHAVALQAYNVTLHAVALHTVALQAPPLITITNYRSRSSQAFFSAPRMVLMVVPQTEH